jgi:hypothetical protein
MRSLEITVFWDYNLEITISLWGLGWSGPKHRVGPETWLEQSAVVPSHAHAWDGDPILQPVTFPPIPVYTHLHAFIFISSLLEGVAAGCSPCLVWLVALDVSYGRHSYCAQRLASLSTSMPVFFFLLSFWGELGCEWGSRSIFFFVSTFASQVPSS